MKRLLALVLLLALAAPAFGVTKQYFSARISTMGTAGATTYYPIAGASAQVTAAAYASIPCSAAGTIGDVSVQLDTAPGAGNTLTVSLFRNGSSQFSIVISNTDTSGSSGSTCSISAGDYVYYEIVASASAAVGLGYVECSFTGTVANESLIPGTSLSTTISALAANYSGLYGTNTPTSTAVNNRQTIPAAGAVSHLYIRLSVDPGTAPDSYTFTLYQGGSPTSLTCTITADATTGNDTAHSVSVSIGDLVYLETSPANSPAASPRFTWGLKFTATTDGESVVMAGSGSGASPSGTEYNYLCSQAGNWDATESNWTTRFPGCVFNGLAVNLDAAPGSGNNYVFTLRDDGADTALTCQIADAATSGSDTAHSVTIGAGSLLCIQSIPTSTPTGADVYWGFRMYIEPAAAGRRVMVIQ